MQVMILIISGIILFAVSVLAFIILFTRQQKVIVPVIGLVLGIGAIIGAWVLKNMGMQVSPFVQSNKPGQGAVPTYVVGETWVVEDQWMLTIVDIKESEYRNEFEDWVPDIVYEVDYQYTNLGYEHDASDGLYMYLEYSGTDSAGVEVKYYSGDLEYYPKSAPVGATCYAQNFIAVSKRGPVTFLLDEYGSDGNTYYAVFIADPDAPRAQIDVPKIEIVDEPLRIGDTWTVDGEWSFTIDGVREISERNGDSKFSSDTVYIVDYTYENLGYRDDQGLFLYIEDRIVDSEGKMGYTYPISVDSYPRVIEPGEICHAQASICVEHSGPFRVYMSEYDSDFNNQKQVFLIETE